MPSLSTIVDVDITLSSGAVATKGFNSLCLLGKSTSFETGFVLSEVRVYSTIEEVVGDSDIKADGEIYKMAQIAFKQQPSMDSLYIGHLSAAAEALTVTEVNDLLESNNEWFGYAGEFNEAADISTLDINLSGKYGFFLIEEAVGSLPSGLDALSHYSSLWHTKSTKTAGEKYVNVAVASRLLALQPGSYTGAFKELVGVEASQYTTTEEGLLRPAGNSPACKINQYSVTAGRAITWPAQTASVQSVGFIDTYIGTLFLQARLEEDVYSVFVQQPKIPYTPAGAQSIIAAVSARLDQSVREGFLKAQPAPVVELPDFSTIPDTAVSSRMLPDIKFFAEAAGAIHTVKIAGNVSI